MQDKMTVTLEGIAPLFLHNGRLANPLNRWAIALKEVASKRNKTDADHLEMARIEWYGSLYTDDEARVCIPGENIESVMVEGAKKLKLGPRVKAGVISPGLWRIEYQGPTNPDEMWMSGKFTDTRGVRIGRNRVMRTRPIFREWRLTCDLLYMGLNPKEVIGALKAAGEQVGLGDFRPKFGRFVIV